MRGRQVARTAPQAIKSCERINKDTGRGPGSPAREALKLKEDAEGTKALCRPAEEVNLH